MKAELWQPLANELGVPWRSAEAMHWLLGEREMARRANTVPFAMVSGANSAGPQGEGNGRIAQTNRMHDSTIYFEASEVAALNATHHADRDGPISMFVQQGGVHMRASGGGSGSPGSEEYVAEGGTIGDYEDGDDGSPGEGSRVPRLRTMDEFVKHEEPTNANEEEGWRLPGLADLDSGISAYVGQGGRGGPRQGSSCQARGPRKDSSTSIHRNSNGSSHGSHRNSNGGSHQSHNGHHDHSPHESRTYKPSSRRGSDDASNASTTSSGGTNGYVQVQVQTVSQKGSGSGGDEGA